MNQSSGYAQPSTQSNGLAITSLVSALVAWIIGGFGSCGIAAIFPPAAICTWLLYIIGCIVAVVTGQMGRGQIRASGGTQTGEGLATTGLILGWIGLGVNIFLICLAVVGIVALAIMGPAISNVFSNIIIDI